MLRYLIIICLLSMLAAPLYAQQKHTVYFENGQSSISLQQLDSIKKWTVAVMKQANSKVLVRSYANDALLGETNYRLAGQRALLLQQCLEREGVPLAVMQIERKVRHAQENGCDYCGELMVVADSNFYSQNIYQELNQEYLMSASNVRTQQFWISPFLDNHITTPEGILVYIPKGSFEIIDSSLIKLEVRYLANQQDILLHALQTRDEARNFVDMSQALHFRATQQDLPLNLHSNKALTIITPSKNNEIQTAFQQKNDSWLTDNANARFGSFYAGDDYFCSGTDGDNGLPNFGTPPAKPVLVSYDSVTRVQTEILESCRIRLEYLASQKFNENGKPQELSPKLKQSEEQAKAKRDRALIAKEKIKIKTRAYNEELEAAYYQQLAIYNKQRSQQQHQYIKMLDSLGKEVQQRAARCAAHQKSIEELKATYGATFEVISQKLAQHPSQQKAGHWLTTNRMGWLALGKPLANSTDNAVPYRIKSNISAYRVSCFLVLEGGKRIVQGEPLDDTDIVFWEVPDNSPAKILAVTKLGNSFWTAWHEVTTSGNPIQLEFQQTPIQEIAKHISIK